MVQGLTPTFLVGLLIISIWSLIWKGFGLWYSSRNGQRNWFVAILLLNTLGLLPIIYLIWYKPENKQKSIKLKKTKKKK